MTFMSEINKTILNLYKCKLKKIHLRLICEKMRNIRNEMLRLGRSATN